MAESTAGSLFALASPPTVRRRWLSGWRRSVGPWAFILPALLLVGALTVYPLGFAGVASFLDYDLVGGTAYFTGLDNYAELFDQPFIHAIITTLFFAVPSVCIELVLGIAIALLLEARVLRQLRAAILAVLLMPLLMAPVVSGATFKLMLNPDFGVISRALGGLDLLGDPHRALWALVGMDIWMWTPFVILLVTAALAGLPDSVLEAAALDGSTPWQRFRYITLPLLRPVLTVIILFRIIDAVKVADIPYVLTQGGPGSATDLVSFHIFRTAFGTFDIGAGSAMAVATILLLMIPVAFLFRAIARPAASRT